MTDLRRGPWSWLDSLLGISLTVLAAVFALHVAIGFLSRDWPWIVGSAAVVVLAVALGAFIRARQRGW